MQDVWNWLTSFTETETVDTETETVDEEFSLWKTVQFFLRLSHTACYQQLQPQFKVAFNAAHTRCLFQRYEGFKHSGIPKQHRQWYDSTGSLFESLWNAPEIRNYFSAFEQASSLADSRIGPECCFKPPPDDYSLQDEYWFPSGRADELRPLRDAVHEFLKTIGVVQEYHLLLAAIIEEFLRKDPCEERPELHEYDVDTINTLYNALGNPTPYMGKYLQDALIETRNFRSRLENAEEARNFRSRQELATNDPIVRRFLALFDGQLTFDGKQRSFLRGGDPYILSELNLQLETLRNVLNDEDNTDSVGELLFFSEDSVADDLSLEFGSLEDWTKAQANSRCPITAGRWEPDTIVPAALKLISFTNPNYGSESVMLDAGNRKVLGRAAKTILSWTFAQYNLMFLQGLLAAFAEMRKPSFESESGTPATDTVKTELQKIAQVCYYSHYNNTRTPDARGMLLEGIASEIFAVYAINRLAKPFSDGHTCHRHKEFDAAKKHYQEVIAAAQHILKFCASATQARWPNFKNPRSWSTLDELQRITKRYQGLYPAQWVQKARRSAGVMLATATHAIADDDIKKKALDAWPQADKPQALAPIYLRKGDVAETLEHFDEALADYQTAKNLAPDNAHVLHELAHFYKRTGNFDAAIDEYQIALALAPDNAEGLYHLAHIYAKRGQNLEEAVQFAQRALQLFPQTETHYIACARQVLGWLYLQQGEAEKAFNELADLELHKYPSLIFYLVLGDAAKAAERHQDAEQAWNTGWQLANTPQWTNRPGATPFEAQEEEAHRTELAERLGIQENAE